MEIIVFIIVAVVFYIVILPFLKNFGENSQHKDSGKITKTKEALKEVRSNYRETKEAISKGFSALEKESRTWPEKAEKWRLEEYEKDYQRGKEKVAEVNVTYRKLGLPEISLIDFFEYNKDYQERAKEEVLNEARKKCIQESEAEEKKKRAAEVEKILAEHKENLAKEEHLRKKKLEAELLKKPQTVEIELNQLKTALVEFIYIRYYLTGQKTFPKLKCIYDSWAKTPYRENELNEQVWDKILEQMSFNSTKCKKIDALYHFTHKDNLASILLKGLLTKKTLEDQRLEYRYNDEKRWDGLEDSISLSFSHPNWKMFYKYRAMSGLNDWVVLKISPTLLAGVEQSRFESIINYDYLDKAIFNKFNAASFSIKNLSIEERKTHKAFLDMFESNIGKTLETYTFDNQAEILYQGNIPKEFIQEIHVVGENTNLEWVRDLGFKLSVNKTVFEKR